MPSYIVQLPVMIQATSALDPSTGAVPAWDVSDAVTISVGALSVTSAPSPRIQVAFTPESTATFVDLVYNTSGASPMLTSSGIVVVVPNAAFKQMRVVTSAVLSTAGLHIADKLII